MHSPAPGEPIQPGIAEYEKHLGPTTWRRGSRVPAAHGSRRGVRL